MEELHASTLKTMMRQCTDIIKAIIRLFCSFAIYKIALTSLVLNLNTALDYSLLCRLLSITWKISIYVVHISHMEVDNPNNNIYYVTFEEKTNQRTNGTNTYI